MSKEPDQMPHFFISYRRSDQEGQYLAHMISRELRRRYGPASVFLDVASRSPGLSFSAKVDLALKDTDVVLVIIGPSWLQRLNERAGDLRDWVRYEISESLKRDSLPVVPICRAGVAMPSSDELPEELRALCLNGVVTLDPFEEVEAQLVRLLSGLENRVETLRGKELMAARVKLIALLRWRARQLELAAWRSAGTKMPRFFISYRRSDQEGQYLAHMISGELCRRYGPVSTFLDIDARIPGLSFRVKVERVLKVTDVVLVIIGPSWLQQLTERVRDPWDWVRHEISESLKRDLLPVVPIYLAGVEMPRPHELPEKLQDLCSRDAVVIDPFQDFEFHLARLLSELEDIHQKKMALQVARETLIALLQWRARQLTLVEERQALRMKLAEVRQASAAREAALAAREAERGAKATDRTLIQTGMNKRHFEARLESLRSRYTDHPVSSEVLQTKISHLKAYGPKEFRSLLDGLSEGVYSQPFGWYCALVHLHHYGRLAFAALEAEEVAVAAPASVDDLVHKHVQDLLHSMEERSLQLGKVVGCSFFLALPLPFVVLLFELVWWKEVLSGIGLILMLILALVAYHATCERRIIRQIALEFGRMFPAGTESRRQAVSELLRRSDKDRMVKELHKAFLNMR